MSLLLSRDHAAFATGEMPLELSRAFPAERVTRLFVEIQVGGVRSSAILDTGGVHLVLDPRFAAELGLRQDAALHSDVLVIRGFRCRGSIHRVPVTLVARAGESLTFEATAFVPEIGVEGDWVLPSFLGWQGCLERIRFAVDPRDEVFYFGALAN